MSILFNQKEESLSLELTTHGRKKLGLGLFRPKYFSFFDDGIIYDQSYSSVEEETNDIQDRILNKSLSFKALNLTKDYLSNPLGNSDIFNDNLPSWDLNILNGKINYIPEKSTFYKKVFDINNIKYDLKLKEVGGEEEKELIIQGDYFVIDIKELNLDEDIENFEIELFMYDEFLGGKQVGHEIPLMFEAKKNNVIDDILYDEEEIQSNYYKTSINKQDVMYYYEILVDDEIDKEYIVAKDRTIEPGKKANMYISDISRTEDTEKPDC